MTELTGTHPLVDWATHRPSHIPLGDKAWMKYVITLASNLPPGSTLRVGGVHNGSRRLFIDGPASGPQGRRSFISSVDFLPDNTIRLVRADSTQSGMGHVALFAHLAAASEAGLDALHIKAGKDGKVAWAYWGVPLNYGGAPDTQTSTMQRYSGEVAKQVNKRPSIRFSPAGQRLLRDLRNGDVHAHTRFLHSMKYSAWRRHLATQTLRKADMWDGMVLLDGPASDLPRMFDILDQHHAARGTESIVTWRPLGAVRRQRQRTPGANKRLAPTS